MTTKILTQDLTVGIGIPGTTTNDSASTGNMGEYVESVVSDTNYPAAGTYGDMTSISLTAGDWDVTMTVMDTLSTGVNHTSFDIGISTTSGNSATGLVQGSNSMLNGYPGTALIFGVSTIPSYRMSLSGTTTVYAKMKASYTSGQPLIKGRLSARRVR